MKSIGAFAVLAVLFQLSILGFIGWVIIKLMQHFGVI